MLIPPGCSMDLIVSIIRDSKEQLSLLENQHSLEGNEYIQGEKAPETEKGIDGQENLLLVFLLVNFIACIIAAVSASKSVSRSNRLSHRLSPPGWSWVLGDKPMCFDAGSLHATDVSVPTVIAFTLSFGMSVFLGCYLDLTTLMERVLDYKFNSCVVFVSLVLTPCLWWLCFLPLSVYTMILSNDPVMNSSHCSRDEISAMQSFINGSIAMGTIPTSIVLVSALCHCLAGRKAMHVALVTSLLVNVVRIWVSLLVSASAGLDSGHSAAAKLGLSRIMIFPLQTLVCSPFAGSAISSIVFQIIVPLGIGYLFRRYFVKEYVVLTYHDQRSSNSHLPETGANTVVKTNDSRLETSSRNQQHGFTSAVGTVFSSGWGRSAILFLVCSVLTSTDAEMMVLTDVSPWLVSGSLFYLLVCQAIIISLSWNLLSVWRQCILFHPGWCYYCCYYTIG
jgi:hypothetical protein